MTSRSIEATHQQSFDTMTREWKMKNRTTMQDAITTAEVFTEREFTGMVLMSHVPYYRFKRRVGESETLGPYWDITMEELLAFAWEVKNQMRNRT
jgi:hypothetical protein